MAKPGSACQYPEMGVMRSPGWFNVKETTDLWLSIPLDLGGLSSMPRGLTEDETGWQITVCRSRLVAADRSTCPDDLLGSSVG
ncbi:hypothetical protein PENANT_c064G09193 [Penicillium antarcticum]|uniref:Uncharacterized protein n=1 Tax=Penicillium antarcticum TaxID=416450 RepID=A0A1V6PPT2_9EURO|nr:hypothetical protein PENANT_c064G09193 [Penicillium antarcticum]